MHINMTVFDRIRKSMRDSKLDALWITLPENHRYLSHFNNPDGQLLVTDETIYVFADFRYTEAAKREAAEWCTVVMPEGLISEWLPKYAAKYVRIGIEEDSLTFRDYTVLKRVLPNAEFVEAASLPAKLRQIKTADEVEKIVRAQRIAEKSLDDLLDRIRPDMTEKQLAAELEYLMKQNGSDERSFDTIAVSGSASSSPHGVPRDVKLENGFLTIDFGAMVDGYHSDMTRTFVIGEPDDDMIRLYNTVLEAQLAGIKAAKCGAHNFECDKAARDIINTAGYEGCFGHSLGHGVGLLIHEAPNLAPRSPREQILVPGEIVTVEPGIYIEGKYGCRIEDMVLITDNGAENLTKYPKEMRRVL